MASGFPGLVTNGHVLCPHCCRRCTLVNAGKHGVHPVFFGCLIPIDILQGGYYSYCFRLMLLSLVVSLVGICLKLMPHCYILQDDMSMHRIYSFTYTPSALDLEPRE